MLNECEKAWLKNEKSLVDQIMIMIGIDQERISNFY